MPLVAFRESLLIGLRGKAHSVKAGAFGELFT